MLMARRMPHQCLLHYVGNKLVGSLSDCLLATEVAKWLIARLVVPAPKTQKDVLHA